MADSEADTTLAENAEGTFWINDGPQVRGTLTYDDQGVRVTTQGIAREPKSVRFKQGSGFVRMDMSGDPRDTVADSAPIPLLGLLDDGRDVTVLDAMLAGTDITPAQTFSGTRVLVGVHAPGTDTGFQAARVALPQPRYWTGIELDGSAVDVALSDCTGALRAFADNSDIWLEFSLDAGLTEREWERRFWNRCITLLRLWTNADVRQKRVELSPAAGIWGEVVLTRGKKSAAFTSQDSLLPPSLMSLNDVAKALELFDKLAPIPDIGVKHMAHEVTIELAVLANASCLEGLHRRCYVKSKPFPGISNKKVEVVASAAAEAAVLKAVEIGAVAAQDREVAIARLEDGFQFFNQPSFFERLDELLPPVEAVAPGLIGQDREAWMTAVVSTRNLEAHRLPKTPESYEKRTDDYYQLAISTEWVLRLSLLLQLRVDAKVLHTRLHGHERFLYALANMDRCWFPWPGSRLGEFRASKPAPTIAED